MADSGETLDKDQFVALMEQFEWRTREEIRESLRADFEFFDKDKSGVLEPSELMDIMTQYSAHAVPEADVNELISNFDRDGDGNINIDGTLKQRWINTDAISDMLLPELRASRTLNLANVCHHSLKPQNSDFNPYIYFFLQIYIDYCFGPTHDGLSIW